MCMYHLIGSLYLYLLVFVSMSRYVWHYYVRTYACLYISEVWVWCDKHAASARAGLREANAEHQEYIFPSKFAISSHHENVTETLIQVCVLFGCLRKENRCALATSEKKRVSPAGKIGIWHCAAVLFLQVPKKCTDLETQSPAQFILYIRKIWQIRS